MSVCVHHQQSCAPWRGTTIRHFLSSSYPTNVHLRSHSFFPLFGFSSWLLEIGRRLVTHSMCSKCKSVCSRPLKMLRAMSQCMCGVRTLRQVRRFFRSSTALFNSPNLVPHYFWRLPPSIRQTIHLPPPPPHTHNPMGCGCKRENLPIVSIFVRIRIRGGYGARDTAEDSRHSVQVVDAASVVGLGVLGQEWLRMKHEWNRESINS